MFENAKVGERVWSSRYGWGEIYNIFKDDHYPLEVIFIIEPNLFRTLSTRYTSLGKCCVTDLTPELFWDEIKIISPQKPKKKVIKTIELYANYHPTTGYVSIARRTAEEAENARLPEGILLKFTSEPFEVEEED